MAKDYKIKQKTKFKTYKPPIIVIVDRKEVEAHIGIITQEVTLDYKGKLVILGEEEYPLPGETKQTIVAKLISTREVAQARHQKVTDEQTEELTEIDTKLADIEATVPDTP